MTTLNPVTPPLELLQQWCNDDPNYTRASIAARAAQWGADQELEACCEWLSGCGCESYGRELRAVRRPKPPSLKQQALTAAAELEGFKGVDTIRRALEALPDD